MYRSFILLLLLGAAGQTFSQSPPKAKDVEIDARFQNYDAERKLLQVTVASGPATLVADPKMEFIVDGNPTTMKLTELTEGTHLNLRVNADKTVVLSVDATGPYAGWKLEAVDPAKRTVAGQSQYGRKTGTFEVTKDAKISKAKAEAKLEDVKAGDLVWLYFTLDGKRVREIKVREVKE